MRLSTHEAREIAHLLSIAARLSAGAHRCDSEGGKSYRRDCERLAFSLRDRANLQLAQYRGVLLRQLATAGPATRSAT